MDLAAFIESGVGMVGASAGDDLVPEAFRVWGVSWDPDGHLRALISSDATRTLATVKPGAWLSLTFVDHDNALGTDEGPCRLRPGTA